MSVAAAAAPLPGGRHDRRPLQLRVSALGALCELCAITKGTRALCARITNALNRVTASVAFHRAAPQGEERPATSKTRRRRSCTSGTQSLRVNHDHSGATARSVASPPARRALVAGRSLLAAHPGAFGPSSCLSRRSQTSPDTSRVVLNGCCADADSFAIDRDQ